MMNKLSILFVVSALLLSQACKKSKDPAPAERYLRCEVDGAPLSFQAEYEIDTIFSSPRVLLSGQAGLESLVLSFPQTDTGRIEMLGAEDYIGYSDKQGNFHNVAFRSGFIHLRENSLRKVSGTFEGKIYLLNPEDSIVIRRGQFVWNR